MKILIGKISQVVVVDVATLPEASRDFLLHYGAKQLLNDAHASIKEGDEETWDDTAKNFTEAVFNAVTAKVLALEAGTIAQRMSAARLSPLDAILHKMARSAIIARLKTRGTNAKAQGPEWMADRVAATVAKYREAWTPEAQRQLAAAKDVTLDNDDLGL